jgi:DNA-binding response OmpR family regulator
MAHMPSEPPSRLTSPPVQHRGRADPKHLSSLEAQPSSSVSQPAVQESTFLTDLVLPALLEEGSETASAHLRRLLDAVDANVAKSHDSGLHQSLALLRQEISALLRLGQSIAELSRLQQDLALLRFEPVELGDLLMSIMPDWKLRAPDHALELALPGELPTVLASPRHAACALDALIEAAVALAPPQSAVRVSIRPQADDVLISVQYSGVPLTSRDLAHLFEPFYSPSGSPEFRVAGGTGLTLARAVLFAHGGRLWAQNAAAGEGAALIATWPLVPLTPRLPPPTAAGTALANPTRLTIASERPVILIMDGDSRMLRYLRANLDVQRFKPVLARDIDEVFRLIDLEEPDLLLLDVSTLGRSERPVDELLLKLESLVGAPMICLATKSDPFECAHLLELGVFDYLAKPFCLDELLARIRVGLRTRQALVQTPPREARFQSGELIIDFPERRVMVGDRQVALSKTEFKLLRVLAEHAGMVMPHEILLSRVWGPGYGEEVEFVWVYIRRLRKKIEPDPAAPTYIQTVPGVGYRLARR